VWEPTQLTPEQFARFGAFIHRATGIRMREGKVTLLSNRIRRRLKALGIESFEDYYGLLTRHALPGELEHFIDAVTTNETFFFRTGGHFDWFAGGFLDDLLARQAQGRHDRSLRAWSAACSSGEEVYSLAICIAEAGPRLAGWRIELLGTDISETMLAAARRGIYPARSVEQVSPERLQRHFAPVPGRTEWEVAPPVRWACSFRRHNLLEPLDAPPQDCIFVRNVMIYFDRESKVAAVRNLVAALAPGGHLVVGPADGISDLLGGLERRSTFLYRKP
jgi:chemotaxis protein methyltransferase CheR